MTSTCNSKFMMHQIVSKSFFTPSLPWVLTVVLSAIVWFRYFLQVVQKVLFLFGARKGKMEKTIKFRRHNEMRKINSEKRERNLFPLNNNNNNNNRLVSYALHPFFFFEKESYPQTFRFHSISWSNRQKKKKNCVVRHMEAERTVT